MTTILQDLKKSYQGLLNAWITPKCDLTVVEEILNLLKFKLMAINFLSTSNNVASSQELLIARDILEIGAYWAIETQNNHVFESYLSQLKHFYFDFKNNLPISSNQYELLALNLLRLLAFDKLAEFHRELDLLTNDEKSNDYIKYPILIEQYLMEGLYNKVFVATNSIPSPKFTLFMDILLNTTRCIISNCIEESYKSLMIDELARMLFVVERKDIINFAGQRGWVSDSSDRYHFEKEKKSIIEELPYKRVAQTMLEYAIELERIV